MTTPNNWQPGQPEQPGGSGEQWSYGQGQPDPSFSSPETSPYGQAGQGYGGFDRTQQYGQGQDAPTAGYEAPGYGQGYEAPGYESPAYGAPGYQAPDSGFAPAYGGGTPPTPPKKGGMPIWGWALAAVAAVAVIGLALAFILPAVFGHQAHTPTPTASATTSTTTGTTTSATASASPSSTSVATVAPNGTYVGLDQRTTPTSVVMDFNGEGNGYGSSSLDSIEGGTSESWRANDGRCTATVWTFNHAGGYEQNDGQLTDQRFDLDTDPADNRATGIEAPTNMDFVATDGTTYQMKQYKIQYNNDKSEEYDFSRTFAGLGTEVIFSLTCDQGQLTQTRIDEARRLVTLEVK